MAGERIAVLGSGANGASIGADLTAAGHDVTLIEQWPEHVEAMRRHGVRIEMPEETLTVPVRAHHLCEVATFTRPFDLVLIVVKAYDARWAARLIEPHLAADGLAVGVQNGMTADVVADEVGPERAAGCVIEVSSMMTEPGVVQRHSSPSRSWFAVGSLGPGGGDPERAAEPLRHAGRVETVADIRATKWMKLVSNCSTLAPTAILGLPMLAALNTEGMRELMVAAGQEALDVGAALGHEPLPIFGLGEGDLRDRERLVEQLLDTLYAGFVLEHTTTTVLHDWLKGRRSETSEINGLVVAEAERLGLEAPVNAAIGDVASQIERGALNPDPRNLTLLRR